MAVDHQLPRSHRLKDKQVQQNEQRGAKLTARCCCRVGSEIDDPQLDNKRGIVNRASTIHFSVSHALRSHRIASHHHRQHTRVTCTVRTTAGGIAPVSPFRMGCDDCRHTDTQSNAFIASLAAAAAAVAGALLLGRTIFIPDFTMYK